MCGRCKTQANGLMEPVMELCDEVETVKSLCYLGHRVNASGGCEAAVIARVRIGWVKFKECGELVNSKRLSLEMKGMVYQSCVRLAMLYGSETWCLRKNEMAVLRRTKRAMVRVMCGVKLIEKKRTEDLIKMLGLKETVVQKAKVNGVRWYRHGSLKWRARGSKDDQRRHGRCRWRRRSSKSVGLEEDVLNRARWRVDVGEIAVRMG